jgi:beta-galactosidase
VRLSFARIDDEGWIFVNNQRVGESHDWSAQPAFDIKNAVHVGDNVIAVRVKNDDNEGGLDPNVNVEIVEKPAPLVWSRSLFNGLAQVIVQSSRYAGEIKLNASAAGLQPAVAVVQAVSAPVRPALP